MKEGDAKLSEPSYQEAIKCHDEALKLNPKYVDARYNEGISLGNLGKHEEAISYSEKLLANSFGELLVKLADNDKAASLLYLK